MATGPCRAQDPVQRMRRAVHESAQGRLSEEYSACFQFFGLLRGRTAVGGLLVPNTPVPWQRMMSCAFQADLCCTAVGVSGSCKHHLLKCALCPGR